MAKVVDLLLEDGAYLLTVVVKYRQRLLDAGMTAAELDSLEAMLTALSGKSTEQKGKRGDVGAETQSQDRIITDGHAAIQQIKNTAKKVFRDNMAVRNEFHINKPIPKTVSGLTAELKYINETRDKYHEQLGTRGIKAKHGERLDRTRENLTTTDAKQEGAKKLAVNTTRERNTVREQLQKLLEDIRVSASNEFEHEPNILKEFETIIKSPPAPKKGGKNSPTEG